MAKATIRDALTLNRYAADIKSTKDRGLVFRRNIVDLSLGTATIVAYGDASFASSEGERSQHGGIAMITHEPDKLLRKRTSPTSPTSDHSGHFELGHLISYKIGSIKRVVRSTLASGLCTPYPRPPSRPSRSGASCTSSTLAHRPRYAR